MKLLHLDSSILGGNSASRQLSAAMVDQLAKATPGLEIVYRDLAAQPLSHLSGEHFAARQGVVPESPAIQKDIAISQAVLDEFLNADIVVIGAPMYNFGIPSQLKAWIDRIAVAGKTFRYGANGPEGLAGNKRVIIAISRGGLYGAGMPAAALSMWKVICAACSAFSASPTWTSWSPKAWRSGPNSGKSRLQGALQAITQLRAPAQLRAA